MGLPGWPREPSEFHVSEANGTVGRFGMIVEGIVSGVASGVILALFFGWRDTLNRYLERRHRIRYLTNLIEVTRREIYESTDSSDEHKEENASPLESRTEIYKELRRNIETVLHGQSLVISFGEINEIRSVFGVWDRTPGFVFRDEYCDVVFEQLESVEWLNLSKGPRFRDRATD